jgi:hypothetical protein
MDDSSEQLEIESLCQLFGRILDQAQLEATQAKLGLQRNRRMVGWVEQGETQHQQSFCCQP